MNGEKQLYSLLRLVGRTLSYVLPLAKYYNLVKQMVYTGFVSRHFKHVGKKTYICPPGKILGGQYISIGDQSKIGGRFVLTAWDNVNGQKYQPTITIGNSCNIGEYCHISAIKLIEIGNNVLTGRWLTVVDNFHGNTDFETLKIYPADRHLVVRGWVKIEDAVWIGDKVTVLSGVTIGHNSVIGANSVVTKDVPPFCVACGNPAKVIKQIQ
jgi:acetyltransferase-like isoleucine patch superfamily enzyme